MSDLGGRRKVKKTTVEECWSLDACSLAKEGVFTCHGVWASSLTWSNSFGEQTLYVPYWVQKLQGEPILHLLVKPDNHREAIDLKVPVQNTRPHFGGVRWWFLCPLFNDGVPCNRRIRKLYRSRAVWYFGCRTCLDLTYRSVQEHDKRIDYLVKHFYLIPAMVESDDPRKSLLALQACAKIYKLF
jgi:hypothetical protein